MGRLVVVLCRARMDLNHSTRPFCSRRRSRREPANAGFRNNRVPPFQYGYAVNIVAFCVSKSMLIRGLGGICAFIWTGDMSPPRLLAGLTGALRAGFGMPQRWSRAWRNPFARTRGLGKASGRLGFRSPSWARAAPRCSYGLLHFRPPHALQAHAGGGRRRFLWRIR